MTLAYKKFRFVNGPPKGREKTSITGNLVRKDEAGQPPRLECIWFYTKLFKVAFAQIEAFTGSDVCPVFGAVSAFNINVGNLVPEIDWNPQHYMVHL